MEDWREIEDLARRVYLEGFEDGKKQKKTPYKYTGDSDKAKELFDMVKKYTEQAKGDVVRDLYARLYVNNAVANSMSIEYDDIDEDTARKTLKEFFQENKKYLTKDSKEKK